MAGKQYERQIFEDNYISSKQFDKTSGICAVFIKYYTELRPPSPVLFLEILSKLLLKKVPK